MKNIMRALRIIAAAGVGAYLGAMAWQFIMSGQLPSNPMWYVVGVPASLLLGAAFYVVRHYGKAGAA